jgi:hypothetical protein
MSTATVMDLSPERPFAGPRPYSERDALFFHGRSQQAEQMARLIHQNHLSLLFGASGLGKSSLLMAGVFPRLRQEDFLPVWVQLKFFDRKPGEDVPHLQQQVMARVREEASLRGLETQNAEDCNTLWEFFHRLELWSPTLSLLTPLIVLDQFEEIFTLGDHSRATRHAVTDLLEALGDVVDNRVPVLLEHALSDRRDQRRKYLAQPSPVRLVLSLREEYLPHLEARRRLLPSATSTQSRLWLTPLKGDQAERAIQKSGGHLFGTGVAESIVRALAGRRAGAAPEASPSTPRRSSVECEQQRALDELSVEPSLLSLVCYQLNERRLRDGDAVISRALVENTGEDILSDFYASCLLGLNKRVPSFIEKHLLSTSGLRLPVPEEDAVKQPGIDAEVVSILVGRRLLRRESRQGTVYLELVHDVLANVVLRARERRHQRGRVLRFGIGGGVAMAALAAVIAVNSRSTILAKLWSRQAREAAAVYEQRQRQVAGKEVELAQREEELRKTQAELAGKHMELVRKEAKLQDTQAELASKQLQLSQSVKELGEAQAMLKDLKKRLEESKAQWQKAEADMKRAEKAMMEAERAKGRAEDRAAKTKMHFGIPSSIEAP